MTARESRRLSRHVYIAGAIWAILTLVGLALVWLSADRLPYLAAEEGAVVDEAMLFLLYLVVPVVTFVLVAVAYAALRFRVDPDDVTDSASQLRTHRGYTLTWLGATSALAVLVILHPGVSGLMKLWDARAQADQLVVEVTARQWEWTFTYPDQGIEGQTELVLPTDQPVTFFITSEDVIHSFWIPAFRIKQDVVPGATTELTLTPDQVGSTGTSSMMRVQCAELCGIGHADMAAVVRVVTPEEFDHWLADVGGGN